MAIRRLYTLCAASIAAASLVHAHGGAHQKPIQVDPEADWATRHMAEEHHISNFDPGAFFALHDYDDNGFWDRNEILKTYGLEHESLKDVTDEKKDEIAKEIFKLIDRNENNLIERHEFIAFSVGEGKSLPDFGLGSGRHLDFETDYEIHHWEKYHDENTKEEDLIHPEDIEHFRRHDELEDKAEKQAAEDKLSIVERNIPLKFRRDGL